MIKIVDNDAKGTLGGTQFEFSFSEKIVFPYGKDQREEELAKLLKRVEEDVRKSFKYVDTNLVSGNS